MGKDLPLNENINLVSRTMQVLMFQLHSVDKRILIFIHALLLVSPV